MLALHQGFQSLFLPSIHKRNACSFGAKVNTSPVQLEISSSSTPNEEMVLARIKGSHASPTELIVGAVHTMSYNSWIPMLGGKRISRSADNTCYMEAEVKSTDVQFQVETTASFEDVENSTHYQLGLKAKQATTVNVSEWEGHFITQTSNAQGDTGTLAFMKEHDNMFMAAKLTKLFDQKHEAEVEVQSNISEYLSRSENIEPNQKLYAAKVQLKLRPHENFTVQANSTLDGAKQELAIQVHEAHKVKVPAFSGCLQRIRTGNCAQPIAYTFGVRFNLGD